MGYNQRQGDTEFCIESNRLNGAFKALVDLLIIEKDLRVDRSNLPDLPELSHLLRACGWNPKYDRNGHLIDIRFILERSPYTEEKIFQALAPYVVPGSYIVMHGEDNYVWRWYFDGKDCWRQKAKITF